MIPNKEDLIPYVYYRKEAAKKFGVTEKTIINWLKKYNLYKPIKNYGCNKLNLEKATEIRELNKNGDSIKKLSSEYNVTFATISRILNNKIYKHDKNFSTINVSYNIKNN